MANEQKPQLKNRALRKAAEMPLLANMQADGTFDFERSEVMQWLRDQPEIVDHMFSLARDKGAIVFVDGKWKGVNS
jgi:hypothetical protein